MARWLVRLEGDPLDLAELPRWFPDGDVRAVHEGDSFYLVGQAFESLGEAGHVHDRALKALDEFSAAISLLDPAFCRPAVGNVHREDDSGGHKGFVFAAARVALRSSLRVSADSTAGEQNKQLPTQAQLLLLGSRTDNHLRQALSLWADQSKTWPRLYRVLEEVEQYLAQPVDKVGFCSKNERGRFTQSANTAEVAGKDARHAIGRFDPPVKPMNLKEATSFVARILRRALDKAALRN